MPFQGKLLGGRSGDLLYQQEQTKKLMQEMADRYQVDHPYYVQSLMGGATGYGRTAAEAAARQRIEATLLFGVSSIVPQSPLRLVSPPSPYAPDRDLWPFSRADVEARDRFDTWAERFLMVVLVALGVVALPAFWWIVRAWAWAFK